jgi:hypothetical protein
LLARVNFDQHPGMELGDIILLHGSKVAVLPWKVGTSAAPESSDFMPVHEFGAKRRKVLSEPGIAGGTFPPCLSAKALGILDRRSAGARAAEALAGIAVMSGGSAQSSRSVIGALFAHSADDDGEDDRGLARQVTIEIAAEKPATV